MGSTPLRPGPALSGFKEKTPSTQSNCRSYTFLMTPTQPGPPNCLTRLFGPPQGRPPGGAQVTSSITTPRLMYVRRLAPRDQLRRRPGPPRRPARDRAGRLLGVRPGGSQQQTGREQIRSVLGFRPGPSLMPRDWANGCGGTYYRSITIPIISNRPPWIGADGTGSNLRPRLEWSGSSARPKRRMRKTSSCLPMPRCRGSVDRRWTACFKSRPTRTPMGTRKPAPSPGSGRSRPA